MDGLPSVVVIACDVCVGCVSIVCCGGLQVLFACFIGSTNNKPCDLVTGGVKHVTFWQLAGKTLVPYNGVFGKKGRVRVPARGGSRFLGVPVGYAILLLSRVWLCAGFVRGLVPSDPTDRVRGGVRQQAHHRCRHGSPVHLDRPRRVSRRARYAVPYHSLCCSLGWGGGAGRGGVLAIGKEGHCHAISSREVQINVIFVFGWDSLVYSSPPTTPLQRTRRR